MLPLVPASVEDTHHLVAHGLRLLGGSEVRSSASVFEFLEVQDLLARADNVGREFHRPTSDLLGSDEQYGIDAHVPYRFGNIAY